MTTKRTGARVDSITGVNPKRNHGVGVWGGPRTVVGIRVDEKLYSAFKPFAQRVFGSVCLPVECFMAALLITFVEAEKQGVNPGKTVKIDVGKILIQRNLRGRRALEFKEEPVETVTVETCCDFCGKRPVVAVFKDVESGIEKKVCSYHAKNLHEHHKWRVVKNG